MRISLITLVIAALSLPLSVARAEAPDAGPSKLGGYVETDLGVLMLFGGVGLLGGVSLGNVRAGLDFYRFESPYRSLSGAPAGFDLKVEGLLGADIAWHPFADRIDGPYVRAIGQIKRQRAENRVNGARRNLDSALLGPEIGWVFRVYHGLFITPRLGALYYVKSPQGKGNHPIDVGGASYDNSKHQTFDFYGTLGLGYAFD